MKNRSLLIASVCAFITLAAGCVKNREIVFDNKYPLATAPDVEWAVVIDPYAAFRKEHSWESEVVGHCRRGDILQVKGLSVNSEQESWYVFSSGWLPASSVDVYSNRLRAQGAAALLK